MAEKKKIVAANIVYIIEKSKNKNTIQWEKVTERILFVETKNESNKVMAIIIAKELKDTF